MSSRETHQAHQNEFRQDIENSDVLPQIPSGVPGESILDIVIQTDDRS